VPLLSGVKSQYDTARGANLPQACKQTRSLLWDAARWLKSCAEPAEDEPAMLLRWICILKLCTYSSILACCTMRVDSRVKSEPYRYALGVTPPARSTRCCRVSPGWTYVHAGVREFAVQRDHLV
jgi:hypothetical protein